MLTYQYDGSFDGFLTSVQYALDHSENPNAFIVNGENNPDLFSVIQDIKTEHGTAELFLKNVSQKLSLEIVRDLMLGFLANFNEKEMILLNFFLYVRKAGIASANNLKIPEVREARKQIQKVALEVHRLKGLLRFHKLADGTFYAPCEPDYAIINLLAPHFYKRLGRQKWIIHDKKRNTAVLSDGTIWESAELDENDSLYDRILANDPNFVSQDEVFYQNLWKTYFKTIAIRERTNPGLQKQFMPKRYWKYLIEKEDGLSAFPNPLLDKTSPNA